MKRLAFLLLAAASAPALAQHEGHQMPAPAPEKKAEAPADPHAGHQAQQTADPHAGHDAAPTPAPPPADPHAGHVMPAKPAADPHAGHDMPAKPAPDPHAGHDMTSAPAQPAADPHAGHDMAPAGDPPVAPPPPEALSGPAHAADAVFGAEAMAEARDVLRREHGSITTYKVLLDQLELRVQNGRDGYAWNAEAWYGGDINRFWLKTEGEGNFGERLDQAEVQALYSRAIDPWWNLQAGLRYDLRPNPQRAHLVLGIEGLAPYWFEVDAALFLSEKGDVRARFEAEYDQRLTQKLILQPRVEFDLSAQDVPEIGLGSGLTQAEAGLRLRYEFKPEFAPYVGVHYERRFGDTARYSRAAGEDAGGWSLLMGVRAWF